VALGVDGTVTLTASLRATVREETTSLVAIGSTVAVTSWLGTATLPPVSRAVTALLSGVGAFLAAAVGLAVVGD
jgi:hypothetical protein